MFAGFERAFSDIIIGSRAGQLFVRRIIPLSQHIHFNNNRTAKTRESRLRTEPRVFSSWMIKEKEKKKREKGKKHRIKKKKKNEFRVINNALICGYDFPAGALRVVIHRRVGACTRNSWPATRQCLSGEWADDGTAEEGLVIVSTLRRRHNNVYVLCTAHKAEK